MHARFAKVQFTQAFGRWEADILRKLVWMLTQILIKEEETMLPADVGQTRQCDLESANRGGFVRQVLDKTGGGHCEAGAESLRPQTPFRPPTLFLSPELLRTSRVIGSLTKAIVHIQAITSMVEILVW